jgi:hypothetical protein
VILARLLRPAWPFAAYLTLAVGLFAGAWRAPFSTIVGNPGDAYQFVWFLRWPSFALAHGLSPLLSTFVNFPQGANLMWNTEIPLVGLVLAPIILSLGPVFAYNLVLTLALALSAWTAYLAIRRYVAAAPAAWLGGLLYGFSPYMIAQSLGHPHLSIAFIPPLILILLDSIIIRQNRPALLTGIAAGVLAAAQLWIGEELLASSALVALLGLFLLIELNRDRIRTSVPYMVKALVAAAHTFVVLAAYPLAIQVFGPRPTVLTFQPHNLYATDVLGFVVPTLMQQIAPTAAIEISHHFTGNLAEWNGYLGIPLIGLLLYTAIRFWDQKLVRFTASLALLMACLSLGFTLRFAGSLTAIASASIALPLLVFRRILPIRTMVLAMLVVPIALITVPVVDDILPGRLMLYTDLMAGFLLAWLVQCATKWPARRRAAAVSAIGLAMLFLLPRLPYPASPAVTPSFFTSSGVRQIPEGAVVLVAPFGRIGSGEAMLWQAVSGDRFRMPEGGVIAQGDPNPLEPPPSATVTVLREIEGGTTPTIDESLRTALRRDLSRWQVRFVIAGPMAHQDQVLALYTSLLGIAPTWQGGIYLWSLPTGQEAMNSSYATSTVRFRPKP